jgi:hypothetical protein
MKTVNDPTYDFVKGIYMQHVPLQTELVNPFQANKRQRKKPVVKTLKEAPEELKDWTAKHFTDYFFNEYKRVFDGVYRVTYTSDNKIINIIADFMEDNQLDKNEWTKKFIDWCFINKTLIMQRSGHFLLIEFPHYLNRYYQDVINTNSTTPLIDIYDEVRNLAKLGRSKELFSKYGIPIVCTYYAQANNISKEDFVSGLNQLFDTLSKGNAAEKKLVSDTFQKSISRSPYVPEFDLLDWREIFIKYTAKYKEETWWRDEDYPGKPRFQFDKFINGQQSNSR